MAPPFVSVVIPTRNRSRVLDRVVRALWKQTLDPHAFEIVVVDNESIDETPQSVERLIANSPVRLRYHRIDADCGPATARNVGARLAAGSMLVFLDSDVELEPQ